MSEPPEKPAPVDAALVDLGWPDAALKREVRLAAALAQSRANVIALLDAIHGLV